MITSQFLQNHLNGSGRRLNDLSEMLKTYKKIEGIPTASQMLKLEDTLAGLRSTIGPDARFAQKLLDETRDMDDRGVEGAAAMKRLAKEHKRIRAKIAEIIEELEEIFSRLDKAYNQENFDNSEPTTFVAGHSGGLVGRS